jgi:endoglucanase
LANIGSSAAIDTLSLEMHGVGAPGFSAALLPMLANARMSSALQVHRKRAAEECLQGNQQCYSDMLSLFGLGWLEQRYRLSVRWTPGSDRPH